MAFIKTVLRVLGVDPAGQVPTGYQAVKEGRAQIQINGEDASIPMVVQVDENGDPTKPLTDAQLRATALAVAGPLTEDQLRSRALAVTADGLSTEATLAKIEAKTPELGQKAMAASVPVTLASDQEFPLPAGAATEATLAQIKQVLQTQLDISSTLWTDDSGAFYVRRDTVNSADGKITVSFVDPENNAAVPGAGLRPVASTDNEIIQVFYDATAAGLGYSQGDVIANVSIVNTTAKSVSFIWINATKQTTLPGSPAINTVQERKSKVEVSNTVAVQMSTPPVGAATDASLAALTAAVVTLTRHVAVQNLILSDMHDKGDASLRLMLNDPTLLTY